MELCYDGKKSADSILKNTRSCQFSGEYAGGNLLFRGDNLYVLQSLRQRYNFVGKIDLIYVDPPFATNNIFRLGEQRVSTISFSKSDDIAYDDNLKRHEYLEFLRERLIIAKELLSAEGSIYLHIDYKIGHYVKIIMDEIFGEKNFRNDIARIKCNPKNFKRKAYGNIKDMILFYSKTNTPIWNEPQIPFTEEDIIKNFRKKDACGRLYTTIPLHAPGETIKGATAGSFKGMLPPKGRHWRSDPVELEALDKQGLIEWSSNGNPRKIIYADEQNGKKVQDIWEYKDSPYPFYPTEKNLSLLKNIVLTSSREGGIVLDFFCGSGTTLIAAGELGRVWIGVDNSAKAMEITKNKIAQTDVNIFNNGAFTYSYLEEMIEKTPVRESYS